MGYIIQKNAKRTISYQTFPVLPFMVGGGLIALTLLFWGLVISFWGYFQVTERILPGIKAAGVDLGGMTRQEAEAAVNQKWNNNNQIIVGRGDLWWRTSSLSLGLFVDSREIVEEAYQTGRGPGALSEWIGMMFNESSPKQPNVYFNEEMARNTLNQVSEMVNVAPKVGAIIYENGKWVARNGVSGRGLDIEKAIVQLRSNSASTLNQGKFELSFIEIKADTFESGTILQELNQIGNKPIISEIYNPFTGQVDSLSTGMENINQFIRWDEPTQNLVLDDDGLIEGLKSQITSAYGVQVRYDGDAANIRDDWKNGKSIQFSVIEPPKTYLVQPGDTLLKISMRFEMPYWYILQSNPGLDQSHLTAGEEIVIPSRNELLPLPYIRSKRIIIFIPDQRMRIFENGQQIEEYVISTGIATSPTLPGVYQVRTHELSAYASNWDLTMPHFLGIYEAWPGFMNGIHGLPTLSNGRVLWGNVLGGPASYGCIILSLENGEALYNWADNGVIVEIVN
jgi:LysM repeat protein